MIDFKGAKLTPPKEPLGEDTSPIAKEFEEEYEKIDDTVKSKPAPSTPPGNKVARKPSGQEFKDRPSERWEFNNWRDKEPCHWHARDVVGYWLDRYRHHLGEEDPDFRCTDVKSLSFIIKHVKDYTQRWMDGKFARSKEIVDKVFEQDASRPRKLMYYFTPTRPGAGAALIERKVRGRMSGHEFNHIGANSSKHDERHKEFVRKLKEGKIK